MTLSLEICAAFLLVWAFAVQCISLYSVAVARKAVVVTLAGGHAISTCVVLAAFLFDCWVIVSKVLA